jgi:hypothetical protein
VRDIARDRPVGDRSGSTPDRERAIGTVGPLVLVVMVVTGVESAWRGTANPVANERAGTVVQP